VKEKYNQLKAVGILGDEKYYPFEINDSINDIDKAVLAVNLQDMQTKLKVFDNLYEKLSTFLEILNQRRLSYKQLSISAKEGFIFTNSKGKNLIPTDLSSGEQHELVLLYLLLFKIPENSLILIDEPEISLHIDWQMDFLNDLTDIVRLRNFDILLSTHSPSIINGHSELTISLDGKD
jgi:ABC-type glutathione transport system ATPase component